MLDLRGLMRRSCPHRVEPTRRRTSGCASAAASVRNGWPPKGTRRCASDDPPVGLDRRARPPFRGQCPRETRALPHATATASPPVVELPEPKHSSWRVWIPVTLTSTVFGLRTLTVKVRRVRPSPTSITPARNWGGDSAANPIVAWNRRALCASLYAGKAVWSPTLQ